MPYDKFGFNLDDWQMNILRNVFAETEFDYSWVSKGPRGNYIDGGVILAGEIQATDVAISDMTWEEARFLDELVSKWNIEYCFDIFGRTTRIRSTVPCITTMEA